MRTTFVYDDPEHPDRPSGSISTPEWTEDDRALLLGLELYEATLCPGCGEPRHLAWHKHSEEEYEGNHFICHACTAKSGPGDQKQEVTYSRLEFIMPPDRRAAMPDFDMSMVTPAREKTTPARGEH